MIATTQNKDERNARAFVMIDTRIHINVELLNIKPRAHEINVGCEFPLPLDLV